MDEEARTVLETYKKIALKRLSWWKKAWFGRCLKIAFVLTVLTVVFCGFGYHHDLKKTVTDFETLTGEEWEKYSRLHGLAEKLQTKRNQIGAYEKLLESYRRGKFSSSYTQSDSLSWVSALQQNKKDFNDFLEKERYNSEIKNYPKFTDRQRMQRAELDVLPSDFAPYILDEAEPKEASEKPEEWIENSPDSTEEQKPDAH